MAEFTRIFGKVKSTFRTAEQMLAVIYMRKVSFFRKASVFKREFVKFAVLGTKIVCRCIWFHFLTASMLWYSAVLEVDKLLLSQLFVEITVKNHVLNILT